eukprot:284516_1
MAMKGHGGKGKQHGGQLVKFSQGKHKFEVVAKQGSVLKYRDGKIGWQNVLMIDQIFTNSTRGDIANVSDLNQVFGTEDIRKCCEEIIKNGELQYTAQERKKFIEDKTSEIIYYINKNYVDPKTKLPHPRDRIAHALKECHIRVDAKGDTRRQAEDAVKKMRGKLMFAKAVALRAKLTIKASHYGQCTNLIHKIANVMKEEWMETGCEFTLELSNADINTLTAALMKPTNGDYQIVFLDENEHTVGAPTDDTGKKTKGKHKKKKKDRKKKKHEEEKTDHQGAKKKKKKKGSGY